MDSLMLCVCGHVGKVQGLDLKRNMFKWSMACNFKRGRDETTLWLQCSIREGGLLELVAQRGLYTGDRLLITSNEVALAAALYGGIHKAFLNVTVTGITFLTEAKKPDALVSTSGTPRILQFSDLEKAG